MGLRAARMREHCFCVRRAISANVTAAHAAADDHRAAAGATRAAAGASPSRLSALTKRLLLADIELGLDIDVRM